MLMQRCFWPVLFILLSIIVDIDGRQQSKIQPPMPFKLSHLTSNQRGNRQSTEVQQMNPCNGTYIRTNGTTCGLKEIIIGRCYQYQYTNRGPYFNYQTNTKDCTELYEAFERAVRYKPFCEINMSTYEEYFKLTLKDIKPIDRGMFWSGTNMIAHIYSNNGHNYITLEDTLAAVMLNQLTWCGKANDSIGFDYVNCPGACEENPWSDVAFWGLASKTFAESVTGEVHVVLNGSRDATDLAFRTDSFFAKFELPNFRRDQQFNVIRVNVLLLHSPDIPIREKCGEKSLLILEDLVRQRGFDYTCEDDPDALLMIMCGNEYNARECQVARRILRQEWDAKLFGQSLQNQPELFLLIFVLFIVMLCAALLT
ncbi:unnamed protein product [Rotaria sordida]|uniref:ADP-ribosyl cyclase/cyclic ADP-ribose hydrolase n=1 Tax=Rotaria sordida TaxID=392033 RepID=A0A814P7Q8_9BILA|nr:unnamed protein product [Rotaria sordida]CAF1307216.1 unnamed protein product [Rotaria sordida]